MARKAREKSELGIYMVYLKSVEGVTFSDFDKTTLSFTYGDSHPTFSDLINDGKEYRKKLYTYDEILDLIEKYGYPQDWHKSGEFGPERYIEVHVWSDETLKKYYL